MLEMVGGWIVDEISQSSPSLGDGGRRPWEGMIAATEIHCCYLTSWAMQRAMKKFWLVDHDALHAHMNSCFASCVMTKSHNHFHYGCDHFCSWPDYVHFQSCLLNIHDQSGLLYFHSCVIKADKVVITFIQHRAMCSHELKCNQALSKFLKFMVCKLAKQFLTSTPKNTLFGGL